MVVCYGGNDLFLRWSKLFVSLEDIYKTIEGEFVKIFEVNVETNECPSSTNHVLLRSYRDYNKKKI